jgi:malate dehydrogenase (quinone)
LKERSTSRLSKDKKSGILEFGTEVITTADGSLSVLLGASPCLDGSFDYDRRSGRCFKEELASPEWQENKKMIPSHGQDLNDNPALSDEIRKILLQY